MSNTTFVQNCLEMKFNHVVLFILAVDPQYIYSKGDSIWHADVTIPRNAPQTIHMTVTPFITDVVQVQALAFHYKYVFTFSLGETDLNEWSFP